MFERRKRVLLLAYWFPPATGPAVTRTAGQVRYLPEAGWDVTAVTVDPRYYPALDDTRLAMVEAATVLRTPCWEPAQWRAIRRRRAGKHAGAARARASGPTLAYRVLRAVRDVGFLPDERIGWLPFAVRAAVRACRQQKPDIVWAVGGPFSALLAGLLVHRLTGVPLVAEFHDGWLDNPYFPPPAGWRRGIESRQERLVLRAARAILCAPPGLAPLLASRLPEAQRGKVHVAPNGYDEAAFAAPPCRGPFRLNVTYVGSFVQERSPDTLLRGLRLLFDERPELREDVGLTLIGTSDTDNEARLDRLVDELGLAGHVWRAGYVPHPVSVGYLRGADILVCVVGRDAEGGTGMFPAKVSEYLRAGRFILGLVPEGAVADVLRASGLARISPPHDPVLAARALAALCDAVRAGETPAPDAAVVARYDMRTIAAGMARVFAQAAAG